MKMMKILVLGIGLSLALACGVASVLNDKLENAQVLVGQQQSVIANQKLEIDGLASELTNLSSEVEALVRQAEIVAQLNAEHDRKSQLIADAGEDWIVNSNKLQVSEHEPTRTWATADLPDYARQLLFDASRSQNGDSKTASVHSTAIKHTAQWLSAAAI